MGADLLRLLRNYYRVYPNIIPCIGYSKYEMKITALMLPITNIASKTVWV